MVWVFAVCAVKNKWNPMVKHCSPQSHCTYSIVLAHHHNYHRNKSTVRLMLEDARKSGRVLGTLLVAALIIIYGPPVFLSDLVVSMLFSL